LILEIVTCAHCGNDLPPVEYDRGEDLCANCADTTAICDDCETRFDLDTGSCIADSCICATCTEDNYTGCEDCGDITPNREMYGNLCEECNNHYGTCYQCGDNYHEEDLHYHECCDQDLCSSCACECTDLHDYNYKPAPRFIGTPDDELYLGVELEIDTGDLAVAEALTAIDPEERLFYLKCDGSLGANGVEIVTHPATLGCHLDGTIPWEKMLEISKKFGYTSHDAKTCGLHVHLSRAGLGVTESDQENTLSNMILLVWNHWPNIQNFSRRTVRQLHWCQPNHRAVDDFTPSKVDQAKNAGRYLVLNNQNRDTVEIRLFRGTLRLETLLATLQFSQHLVNFCKGKEAIRIVTSTWAEFTADVPEELQHYMGVRKCA